MMNTVSISKRQKGIGLIEILVSIVIGSILILAITSMYGKFYAANKLQEEQSIAQDQANFAFISLNRAIRMAGAGICVNPNIESNTYLHQETPFSGFPPLLNGITKFGPVARLHSFSNPTGKQLGTGFTTPSQLNPPVNSDALLVMYSDSATRRIDAVTDSSGNIIPSKLASPYHARHLASPRTANDPLFYYDSNNKILPTWIMISDCSHTGVFEYTKDDVSGNMLLAPRKDPNDSNSERNFLYNFGRKQQIVLTGKLHAQLYFVAVNNSDHGSQLYVKDLLSPNTDAQPIATDVKAMRIEYRDPTTNSWVDTAARNRANNWDKDWPVRITLVMNAGDQLEDQQYTRVLGIRN